ncbi:Lipoyltransferase and lipoate-protein ligase, partial [Peniophora sp. CONT]
MLRLFRPTTGALRTSCRRHISGPTSPGSLAPQHSIYVSRSTNPYFNLTLEDWLFRFKNPKEPLLLLYRDEPCVVIGRNQNPWKEVNLPALREMEIPWIRRRSGGGTVYHDTGNTNFSIHLPRTSFDRHATAQIILRAVRSLDIDASVNDRNDVVVGPYKVSGSAYKIVNNRAYHHGTMLLETELGSLGDALRVSKDSMVTRGVASVRSPVRNLCWFNPDISHDAFVEAVIRAFREEYGISEEVCEVDETEDLLSIPYIREGMAELTTWDWAFGQTPEFTYTLQRSFAWGEVTAELRSKHGLILGCEFKTDDAWAREELETFGVSLAGKRYGFMDSENSLEDGPVAEVSAWLAEETSK